MSATAITIPIATSWTIPLRTGFEPTPSASYRGRDCGPALAAPSCRRPHAPRAGGRRPRRSSSRSDRVLGGRQERASPTRPARAAARKREASRARLRRRRPFRGRPLVEARRVASALLTPIEPVLEQADIAVVNLETAVTNGGAAAAKKFIFRAPASAFEALRGGSVRRRVDGEQPRHGLRRAGLRDSLAAARRHRFPVSASGCDGKQAYAPYRGTVNGASDRDPRRDAGARRPPHLELDRRAGEAGARVGEGGPAAAPGGPARAESRGHRRRLPALGRRARGMPDLRPAHARPPARRRGS